MSSGSTRFDSGARTWVRSAAFLVLLLLWPVFARAQNFSVRYVVSVDHPGRSTVQVRWELAGIDEIEKISLRFRHAAPLNIEGSGELRREDDRRFVWQPRKPYARLSYRIEVNSPRGTQGRFDSYLGREWLVTRARQLFPLVAVHYRSPDPSVATPSNVSSRATLSFQVPAKWRCVSAYAARSPNTFVLKGTRSFLTPRGWFACGTLVTDSREINGVHVELATVEDAQLNSEEIFSFLEVTFPLLQRLLGFSGDRILVVRAGDPMWHGGISGEGSLFLHYNRPLRDPDKTSPYLHELFHVMQPFKPAADADWFVEGLAEFYSLELQRRAGLLDGRAFQRGLRLFERYGLWDVDLRNQHDNAATNNSAPLVLYALDQRIQRLTAGKARLDDVVRRLGQHNGRVDSAMFARAAEAVAGAPLSQFFQRYVYAGQIPKWNRFE
ncbi:MAG: hypothetical protein KatS3mg077_0423 [Candidatus Binatia bacterium]|nr:MAG: hypothetical protein KatS3mg077_0423 [Candidatus Binatia bacterium]